MKIIIEILIGVSVVAILAAFLFRKLLRLVKVVNDSNETLNDKLEMRHEIFKSFIDAVKKNVNYEKSVLKEVVTLRTAAKTAQKKGYEDERMVAENSISRIIANLSDMFEEFPELRNEPEAMQLQEKIVDCETELSDAKQAYNEGIKNYDDAKVLLLEAFIVSIFSKKLDKSFTPWIPSEPSS